MRHPPGPGHARALHAPEREALAASDNTFERIELCNSTGLLLKPTGWLQQTVR
jgi:hypothetical protein